MKLFKNIRKEIQMINQDVWATDDSVPTPEKIPNPVGYRILIDQEE